MLNVNIFKEMLKTPCFKPCRKRKKKNFLINKSRQDSEEGNGGNTTNYS